ncbi:MAG: hypothetical protein KDL87_05470 [Verrucomicrobiae bacterium]|nr:hypothetical protein [Verrucomicrobiae bacterium]
MTRPFLFPVLMCLASLARGEDVLHLKDGTVVRCEIQAITDNILTYKTTIDLGGGRTASAQPTVPTSTVDYIEFGPLPGETELMASPQSADPKALEKVWDETSKHLHRPRSNAGAIGLAYADRLLRLPESFQWDFALTVFDRIRERDWNPAHRDEARKGRLRALIQLGRLKEATAEAKQLATETDDPEMLIEARYAMARADFVTLKALEADNPKWEEDDTVRPERNRLYHSIIDQFLWPYLFHGTLEELAARGLAAAAEAHDFAGHPEEATACRHDLGELYPQSASAEALRAAKAEEPVPPTTGAPLPN